MALILGNFHQFAALANKFGDESPGLDGLAAVVAMFPGVPVADRGVIGSVPDRGAGRIAIVVTTVDQVRRVEDFHL